MTACSTCRHHHDNGIIRCDLDIPDFRRVYKGEIVCVYFQPETISELDKLRVVKEPENKPEGWYRNPFHEISALNARIAELKAEIERLKKENAVLKGRVADLSVDKFCEATVTAENERLKAENATLRAELLAALRELRGKA